jgi:hypothetical protein
LTRRIRMKKYGLTWSLRKFLNGSPPREYRYAIVSSSIPIDNT